MAHDLVNMMSSAAFARGSSGGAAIILAGLMKRSTPPQEWPVIRQVPERETAQEGYG
jgi:hypothetical protein